MVLDRGSKMAGVKRELVVITGMSGAGRSTIAHAMEDAGWYVIDNLPPAMLPHLFELTEKTVSAIAVVVDVRGREFFDDLNKSLAEVGEKGISKRILFVDASDDALVRRFESTRRPHPLQAGDRIVDGIARERTKLNDLRSSADLIIDSSELNIHQLEKKTGELFHNDGVVYLAVNVLSFGYKYGIPVDADLVMDCRFIPNPHWIPELRPLNGTDSQVSEMVLNAPNVNDFLSKYVSLFQSVAPGYIREGKKFITLAVGCTGGKHRSVAIAAELRNRLSNVSFPGTEKVSVQVAHRDLGRER